MAQEHGKPSAAIILNELRRLTEPPRREALPVPDALLLREESAANFNRYDSLLEVCHG